MIVDEDSNEKATMLLFLLLLLMTKTIIATMLHWCTCDMASPDPFFRTYHTRSSVLVQMREITHGLGRVDSSREGITEVALEKTDKTCLQGAW